MHKSAKGGVSAIKVNPTCLHPDPDHEVKKISHFMDLKKMGKIRESTRFSKIIFLFIKEIDVHVFSKSDARSHNKRVSR